MAYPQGKLNKADACALNPTLHTGLLNGLVNAAQAVTTLDGVGGIGTNVRLDFLRLSGATDVQNRWTVTVAAAYMLAGHLSNIASGLNGDSFEVCFFLPSAGVWTIYLSAPRNTDEGILKLFVGDAQVGNAAGYDLYNNPIDPVNLITTAVFATGAPLVLAAGCQRIRFLVDGKNAASAGYIARLQQLSIVRTG